MSLERKDVRAKLDRIARKRLEAVA